MVLRTGCLLESERFPLELKSPSGMSYFRFGSITFLILKAYGSGRFSWNKIIALVKTSRFFFTHNLFQFWS